MSINSWNDGYETHDTKKAKGRLVWVRQNILMGDVRWAKLWLRQDASQVWAGWTAVVWCAAQSDERGTITSAEDVSILSRVPIEMVKMGLEWGFSCGFVDLVGNPDEIPTLSRYNPDEIPQLPEIIAPTLRDETRRDETRRVDPKGSMSAQDARTPYSEIWAVWKKANELGYGVKHISMTDGMKRSVKARMGKLPAEIDRTELAKHVIGNAMENKWLADHPDAFRFDVIFGEKMFNQLSGGFEA